MNDLQWLFLFVLAYGWGFVNGVLAPDAVPLWAVLLIGCGVGIVGVVGCAALGRSTTRSRDD